MKLVYFQFLSLVLATVHMGKLTKRQILEMKPRDFESIKQFHALANLSKHSKSELIASVATNPTSLGGIQGKTLPHPHPPPSCQFQCFVENVRDLFL